MIDSFFIEVLKTQINANLNLYEIYQIAVVVNQIAAGSITPAFQSMTYLDCRFEYIFRLHEFSTELKKGS